MLLRRASIVSSASLMTMLLLSCSAGPNPTAALDAPAVLTVVPETNGIGTNRQVSVVFTKPMDPSTITTNSFKVVGATGTVIYDAINRVAAFSPSPDFAPNTAYNATITTAATDLAGTPLAAPFSFAFTTRSTKDTSAPYIVAVNLSPGATCVPLNQTIQVTFDEQVSSQTVNSSTFFIAGVAASVTYNVLTHVATLTPTAGLAPNTTYKLSVTAGVTDQGGVPLSPPLSLSFSTCSAMSSGTQPVALCPYIGNFAVLAGTTVTNTGATVVTGDVGVSPGTAITGFPPGLATGTLHSADGAASTAQATLTSAYNDAAGRSGGTAEAGDLVGQTLTPGVYTSTSTLALSGDLTLDGKGDPNAVFIFQIGSTLTTGSGSHVLLTNGATACNVFWQVGSSATLGTNSVFNGNILALTSITLTTGVNLQGRVLARNGAVTLDSDIISGCTCPTP